MAEYDPKPRKCINCGYLFKEEEKQCPNCKPIKPHRRQPGEKDVKEIKTEPWFCPDCRHKFPPEFQECPVCKAKTHVFCDDCGSLHSKKEPCPICDDEITETKETQDSLKEADEALDVIYEKEQDRIVTEEKKEKLKDVVEQCDKIPLEEVTIPWGKPGDKRKQPWTEERKEQMRKLRQEGRVGRPPKKMKQTQSETKKEALKQTQAAKKADGRKNNRPPKAREKQHQPEETPREAPPLPIDAAPEKPVLAILKLDLDGKNGLNQLCDRLWIIKYLGLKVEAMEIYHTTNGFHAVLNCDNIFKSWEILLFQTWLGSDFRREMCNLLKIERGTQNWNNLFKEKWKYNVLGEEVRVSQEKIDTELSQKVLRLIQLGD